MVVGADGDSLVVVLVLVLASLAVIPNAVRDLEKGRECEVRSLTAFGMTGLAHGNAQRSTLNAQRSTRTAITTRPATHPPAAGVDTDPAIFRSTLRPESLIVRSTRKT
jgi:hypothetical protein